MLFRLLYEKGANALASHLNINADTHKHTHRIKISDKKTNAAVYLYLIVYFFLVTMHHVFFFVLFPLSVNLYFLALHEFYEHLVLQAPDIAKVLQIYYSSSACGRSMNE